MTDHPLPWRAICRYCNEVLSTTTGRERSWVNRGDTQCFSAPPQDNGDPGHHRPNIRLSINGQIPEDYTP